MSESRNAEKRGNYHCYYKYLLGQEKDQSTTSQNNIQRGERRLIKEIFLGASQEKKLCILYYILLKAYIICIKTNKTCLHHLFFSLLQSPIVQFAAHCFVSGVVGVNMFSL